MTKNNECKNIGERKINNREPFIGQEIILIHSFKGLLEGQWTENLTERHLKYKKQLIASQNDKRQNHKENHGKSWIVKMYLNHELTMVGLLLRV
jgi:hypothetical protein